jgi:hypothetical protein
MSVVLDINDYDDYNCINSADISMNDISANKSVTIELTTINDISHNASLGCKHKKPLDILNDVLKLKIDTINPLELLDYDYEEQIGSTGEQYSRISYTGVEKSLETLYSNANETSSSAMDILATYVRGQKLIYMEAKDFCESYLNYYMMPCIFLSATASVLSPVSNDIYMGGLLLAALNAFISFLLGIKGEKRWIQTYGQKSLILRLKSRK